MVSPASTSARPRRKGRLLLVIVVLVLVAWAGMGYWQRHKPLPDGVGVAWPVRHVSDAQLLIDGTWYDAQGQQHRQQAIFDEQLAMIRQARKLIVLDMFLFNDFAGSVDKQGMRSLSSELSDALIEQKRQHPDMVVRVITDPINTLYGALRPDHLERLRQADIELIITELDVLRASNPLWSGLWHLGLSQLGNSQEGGWLPNPLGPGRITLRSYLAMANFRANHRKTLVVDQGESWAGLVSSANAHDASSRHSNVALRFQGPAALDLLASERAVADWSQRDEVALSGGWPASSAAINRYQVDSETRQEAAQPSLRILTEAAIRDALLSRIERADAGDQLDIAVFYLAHRDLIEALKSASGRGVVVRVLLDPNLHAFGMQKNGLPNHPVANELAGSGVDVRWCLTQGEQCHSKLMLYRQGTKAGDVTQGASSAQAVMILGSANFTRRNLDNLNLETSVELVGNQLTPAIDQASELFERRWFSSDERRTSLPLSAIEQDSAWARWRYRLMEATGLSTF
ncbi:phospholipase D-like domain-containing protein [Halomonas halocynthiae]|uniref:phospholipase D-like domain-containing protein n=1 Tax=Halomonas halocynthiae TaxID=176290 RepID=UPI0004019348|nr:phospholipase D-like domain-containing protein [Halomonas halocynthiae]